MKVSEIISNELTLMTPDFYQEFAQNGCVPACHLTHEWINIGDKFKLATVDNKSIFDPANENPNVHSKLIDVMLAEKSSVEDYVKYKQDLEKERLDAIREHREAARKEGRTGCYRIDGKIVH
jgi:translation initiation factor 2B subunit (eIF-2B alpha/beta/delta family)